MSNKESQNGMYISSSNDLAKHEDLFMPKDNEQRDNVKQELVRPQTQSQLSSAELIEDVPVPKLMLYISQMSIDDCQNQTKKPMSIEGMSPMKYSPPKKQERKVQQEAVSEIRQFEIQEIPTIQQIQTRRKGNKANYNVDDSPVEQDEMKPCHCTKTHCLQLYCSCFHNRRRCMSECRCNDCYNDGQHEEEVQKAVEQIKIKEQRASHHDLDSFDTKQVWGCKCKKTKCVKGYCECFIRGKKCTSHCQCTECENRRMPQKKQKKNQQNTQINKKIKKKSQV
ncbi:unnamed protein product (macronuclear) [Paramecium tetraurelia]|uniref:CRC domain-containing protein n=1 Tax=Paramecium tetraurelia TaxID=5888 RepID=A0BZ09_PARTE|nr:uncharacterized protein GSPATT00033629001 [Paramecium tetraurelia]CAK63776.1 unnamed protein product [Paramecium tetraurelia]|eukprot:XP_001431174.1 hypothetical protein (macronuclear) [Paramecium tetraurelia strain d4-2]